MGEILFLAHRIPFPPDRGDKIRSWNLVKKLAEIAPIHIAAFADDARDLAHAPALGQVAASHKCVPRDVNRPLAAMRGLLRGRPLSVALFDHPELRAHVEQILAERSISAIVAFSCQMAQYVPEAIPGIRFIMDFVDVDSAKYAAYGQNQHGPMAWINRREGRKLLDFERQVAARADACLFVSQAEAQWFRELSGLGPERVIALENGVDLSYFSPDAAFEPLTPDQRGQGPLIAFTGQMDYRPNVEAVEGFARNCLPRILERHPASRFAIVGRNPAPAVRALASLPGIVVTGAVSDVRGWLAAADIVVAPLRLARGVQNKVLEAMAMARPVIASPQAAEGIDAVHGRDILVAKDSAEEGAAVLHLLGNRAAAEALGRAARARVEARYSWSATLAGLADIVDGGGQQSQRAVA